MNKNTTIWVQVVHLLNNSAFVVITLVCNQRFSTSLNLLHRLCICRFLCRNSSFERCFNHYAWKMIFITMYMVILIVFRTIFSLWSRIQGSICSEWPWSHYFHCWWGYEASLEQLTGDSQWISLCQSRECFQG